MRLAASHIDIIHSTARQLLGEDVQVKAEISLNGAVVLPHKEVKETTYEPKIIL